MVEEAREVEQIRESGEATAAVSGLEDLIEQVSLQKLMRPAVSERALASGHSEAEAGSRLVAYINKGIAGSNLFGAQDLEIG